MIIILLKSMINFPSKHKFLALTQKQFTLTQKIKIFPEIKFILILLIFLFFADINFFIVLEFFKIVLEQIIND